MPLLRIFPILALCFMTLPAIGAADVTTLKKQRSELDREIRALATDRSCKSDADCSSIGYGAKACGGPKEYLISSRLNPKSSSLSGKIARFNQIDKQINDLEGAMSTCDVEAPPKLSCKQQVCTQQVD